VKYKRKIVATAASSRPKRHQGINKYLNENAVVPASDVQSSSSEYSHSPSPFLPSDSSTDTENSGEEREVKNNLEKEMSDQPVFGNNSNKQGKEIVAQPYNTMKNNAGVEEEKNSSGPTGQDKEKPAELSQLMKRGPILVTPIKAPRLQHNRMVTDKQKVYRVKRRPNPVTQKLTLTRMTHLVKAMRRIKNCNS
jgi:hypothetical protein